MTRIFKDTVLYLILAAYGLTSSYAQPADASRQAPPGREFMMPDIKQIADKGELTVAIHAEDSPPFFYRDRKGNLTGVDIHLAELIAQYLNVKLKFYRSAATYNDLLAALNKDKADIAISAVYPTLDRGKTALFTESYFTIKPVMIINRVLAAKMNFVKGRPLKLDDATVIGIYEYAFYREWAQKKFPGAVIKAYPGHSQRKKMIQDLVAGNLTAVFIDEIEALKWPGERSDFGLYAEVIELSEPEMPLAIALPWKKIYLKEWLNLFICEMKKDQGINEQVKKHALRTQP